MTEEKKTRPTVGGRAVPVTALADTLMDEVIRDARRRRKDLSDKAIAQEYTDAVVAGRFGGELGKAFSRWLKSGANADQKKSWPVTFRTYLKKYHAAGGVPNAEAKRAKLSAPQPAAAAARTSSAKKTARKSSAKKASRKAAAKKPTGRKKTTNHR